MSFGFFGDLFDLNGDGKLDWMEQAMDEHAFYMMMEEQKKAELESAMTNNYCNSCFEEEEHEEELMDELEMNGIDSVEFEFMDDDERREVLEEAGLDPDDYDFY